ncbi:hypothetical protein GCM10008908_09340 [Clostridium subterminale]|uniref:IrrE N-terminal-like domain-containing protein n=1 Tax=Clostridium subterminale TaxID=1550 RepID=A0ABP3VWT9_CLOSU
MEEKFMGIDIIYDKNLNYEDIQFYKKLIIETFNEMNFEPKIDGYSLVRKIELCCEKDKRLGSYEAVFRRIVGSIIIHVNIHEEDEKVNFKELLFHELTHAIFEFNIFYKELRNYEYLNYEYPLSFINEYNTYKKTYNYFIKELGEEYAKRLKNHFNDIHDELNNFKYIENNNENKDYLMNLLGNRFSLSVIFFELEEYSKYPSLLLSGYEIKMVAFLQCYQDISSQNRVLLVKEYIDNLIQYYKVHIWKIK